MEKCLEELKQEAEEDASAEERRVKAARERAAQERKDRLKKALEEREKLVPKRERRKKGSGEKARASMKRGEGGFRPAYNVPFATTADSRVIVGVDVTNAGTDGGPMKPRVEQVGHRDQKHPEDDLAEGAS